MEQLIRKWIVSCEQCIRESRIHHRLTTPQLQNYNEHFTAAEDAMQNHLVPELPPSGGYENMVTVIDVLSRFFFLHNIQSRRENNCQSLI